MSEYYNPEVQQLSPDTCAIKSQQLILKDFGIDVSETELVQAAKLRSKIIIGGAVITPSYASEIEADGYSKDANEAVVLVKRLLNIE